MWLSSVNRAVTLLVGLGICAAAPSASGQAPLTLVVLTGILDSAAKVSHRIDSLNTVYAGAQRRAEALVGEFRRHNDEPCSYLEGHPEMCDSYDRERQDLNFRSQELQKEMKAIDAPRRELRTRFEALMTRLRTASYPASLAGQHSQLVACSNANGVAESAACLARVQRRLPRTPASRSAGSADR